MDGKIYINAFNEDVLSLIQELKSQFPSDRRFKRYQIQFDGLCQMNRRAPLLHFLNYALPFTDQIKNHDEKFFMDYTVRPKTPEEHKIIQEIFQIKDLWKTLSRESQQKIWKIINDLLMNACTAAAVLSK